MASAWGLMNRRDPVHWLATGFGSGLVPKAPGTAGTVGALPLWYLLQPLPPLVYLAVLTAAFALGCYLCGKTSRDWQVHDHGAIVWDEFVGLWIALFLLPGGIGWVLGGFVLFRFFDIIKPWPIRWLDRHVHGGAGIMIDDVVAGLFAWLVLQGLAVALPL